MNEYDILMIDDEADMCWAVQRILATRGYRVTIADSGAKALAQVKKNHFPLILLDAKLPDIEGLLLAQSIRKHLPDCHIILLSGYFYCNDTAITDALTKKLINDFVAKPFSNVDVAAAVDRGVK